MGQDPITLLSHSHPRHGPGMVMLGVFLIGFALIFVIAKLVALGRIRRIGHLLLACSAVLATVVNGLYVMSMEEASGMALLYVLWVLLWVTLFVVFIFKNMGRDFAYLFIYPTVYFILTASFKQITDPQIEQAFARAAELRNRLEAFHRARDYYPISIFELTEFDGKPIPKTGIGIWGSQDFHYRVFLNPDYYHITFPGLRGKTCVLGSDET